MQKLTGADYRHGQQNAYFADTAGEEIPSDADTVTTDGVIGIILPSMGCGIGKVITVCASNGTATVTATSPSTVPLLGGGSVVGSGSRTYTLMAITVDGAYVWAAQNLA